MTVEQKVITKVRAMLLADATVTGYTDARIYPSHISTVDKPIYPAMSIHLLPSAAKFAEVGFSDVTLQIDAWLPQSLYSFKDTQIVHDRIRALFQRQKINDATIGVYGYGYEINIGPFMVEEDTKILHLPAIYRFTAMIK